MPGHGRPLIESNVTLAIRAAIRTSAAICQRAPRRLRQGPAQSGRAPAEGAATPTFPHPALFVNIYYRYLRNRFRLAAAPRSARHGARRLAASTPPAGTLRSRDRLLYTSTFRFGLANQFRPEYFFPMARDRRHRETGGLQTMLPGRATTFMKKTLALLSLLLASVFAQADEL